MSIWADIGFDGIWVDPVSPSSPSAAAKDLKNKSSIVIAVDAAYPASRSTRYPGIELMLWLRLREKYAGPILLIGFQSSEAILFAHPEHLALLAPDNRYERLPLSEETKTNIKRWLGEKRTLTKERIAEKYKPYLSSAFDISAFRHRMANIYGLKVMWDAMKQARPTFGMTYPVEVAKLEQEDLGVCLGFELLGAKKVTPPSNSGPKPPPTVPPADCATIPGLKLCYVDDYSGLGWSGLLQHLVYAKKVTDEKVFHRVDVQRIGRDNANFKDKVDAVVKEILRTVKGKNALLLDLKLFPKQHDDAEVDVVSLSGAKVLQELRKQEMSLPILVTTASNKIWSYEDIMKLGADGYWVKPGLEDAWTKADVEENVQRLRRFLSATQHPMVLAQEALEKAERRILDQLATVWWARGTWPYGYKRRAEPMEIYIHLSTVLNQLRIHNQRYTYDDRDNDADHVHRSLSSVAVSVGVVFEAVVGSELPVNCPQDYRDYGVSFMQCNRVNSTPLRNRIMKARNKAAHPDQNDGKPTVQDLVDSINGLTTFLLSREPEYIIM